MLKLGSGFYEPASGLFIEGERKGRWRKGRWSTNYITLYHITV